MGVKLLELYETCCELNRVRKFNRLKRQLNDNATGRAIIDLVCLGALSVGQGKRLVKVGRPL